MLYSLIERYIKSLQKHSPGYVSALTSGYVLMLSNILIQFVLVPFYIKYLGQHQFGLLMMLMSMLNFAAIGITWMSGGLIRIMGERWANHDAQGFRDAFIVGKYVFTFYAIIVVVIGVLLWFAANKLDITNEQVSFSVALAGLYFILLYENNTERQAFVGANIQTIGNSIEVLRIIGFALLSWILVPIVKDVSAVWLAMIAGIILQRILTGIFWYRKINNIGWGNITHDMKPIFQRLVGRQGAGYISYGVFLLILQADTMIVGFLGGADMAGKFVLLWKIPESIGLLLWKIPSTMEPRAIQLDASGENNKLYSIFKTGRNWYFILVLIVSLSYILFGKWLTEIWVGDYAPDHDWMYIVAGFSLFFNAFARWPISFAYALIKLRPLTMIISAEVVSKLLLTVVLFGAYNIAAPLLASVITHILFAAYFYQRLIRKENYIS
ncbi:MAG: hypothetical protein OEY52_03140 [Gammaproteobacteria bacterium]|nr:hypothetical protein [Gammaproteobacteria bacterium]